MLDHTSSRCAAARRALLVLPLAIAMGACDSASVDGSEYAFGFRLAPATGFNAAGATLGGDELVLTGENGTLTISAIRFVVGEFELESAVSCDHGGDGDDLGAGGGDDDDGDGYDECEVELPPAFVSLPLGGEFAPIGDATVPAGTYDEFEFEVENLDLEDDDDDENDRLALERLISEVRAAYPQWPERAGAVIEGTFTPTGGSSRSFLVFAAAEIEIEREFEPPLVVSADGRREAITIRVDPAAWFALPGGEVLDLSAFDYETTGEVIEIELEDGFLEVEEGGDGDD